MLIIFSIVLQANFFQSLSFRLKLKLDVLQINLFPKFVLITIFHFIFLFQKVSFFIRPLNEAHRLSSIANYPHSEHNGICTASWFDRFDQFPLKSTYNSIYWIWTRISIYRGHILTWKIPEKYFLASYWRYSPNKASFVKFWDHLKNGHFPVD